VRKVIKTANKFAIYISAIHMGCLLLLIVLDVFLRNTFMIFIPGVFELSRLLLSVSVLFALAYANDEKKHVVVELLYKALPRTCRRILSIISSLFFVAVTGVLSWFLVRLGILQYEEMLVTPALRIAVWVFTIICALGMLLLCLSAFCSLLYSERDGEVQ